MGSCVIKFMGKKGFIKKYCHEIRRDIFDLKSEFKKINRSDEVIKLIGKDRMYDKYCSQLDDFLDQCKCNEIPLKCYVCSEEEHEGINNYFCKCGDRNIKLAKQLRANKMSAWQ